MGVSTRLRPVATVPRASVRWRLCLAMVRVLCVACVMCGGYVMPQVSTRGHGRGGCAGALGTWQPRHAEEGARFRRQRWENTLQEDTVMGKR